MSTKTIRLILVLMLITIGSLFVTQAYWFKKTFSLQESQLDEKINIALRNVANELLKLDQDFTTRIPPITKVSSNEFLVETDCYFTLHHLDSCLRSEFALRELRIEFDYYIIETGTFQLKSGNSVFNLFDTAYVTCRKREDEVEKSNFKIQVHNKTSYLINTMGIWMFSSISLLAILAVFTFIIVSIIKGKNLSILKKDFVNNMTHELKTPIANISVASEAIRNPNIQMDNLKLKKYADIIYKENNRLHGLVDRVLQISTIEKKEESMVFETCDIHKIITKSIQRYDTVIQERKGSIGIQLNASKYTMEADPLHISNVIHNLVENAIKYSANAPEIQITTSNTDGGITIDIQDSGIGISKENQERIFEKFFRAETGNIHNTKGHGLGLSYVKLIVEIHQGNITFSSKLNEGSTFSIFLPL